MPYATKSLASRIEWCRRQSTQAQTQLERAGWHAEADGLRDALLNKNHTYRYQQGQPDVFERYAMGLQYGREVLRTAFVYHQFSPPTHTATTGRQAGLYGIEDESTRRIRILGLTRRAEADVHASRVAGKDKTIMGRVRATESILDIKEETFE